MLAKLEQNVHFFVPFPSLKISVRVSVDADNERYLTEPALGSDLAVNQVFYALITTIVMYNFESILLLLRALDSINCPTGALPYFPVYFIHYLSDLYLIL